MAAYQEQFRLDIAISLLLAAHLLCVNIAAGGPLLAAWLDLRGVRGNAIAASAGRSLAGTALAALLGGGLLGFVIGWLKWTSAYQALWLGPLRYKLGWAGAE